MALNAIAGDLVLSDDGKSFLFAANAARLEQRIAIDFLTPFGSNKYDTTAGFDWETFVQRTNGPNERTAMIKQKLLSFPEVSFVVNVEETFDKAARSLVVEYRAVTAFDEIISGTVVPLVAR